MYRVTERDYYYIPTPEGADSTFDPVIWTREECMEPVILENVIDMMYVFNNTHEKVMMTMNESGLTLSDHSDSEDISHKDYYYTKRHEMHVETF